MPGSESKRRPPEGVVTRHRLHCAIDKEGLCDCVPAYQAQVWSPADGRTIRKTFRSRTEARVWRSESQLALRRGSMRAPTRTTLREAAGEWLAAAEAGIVRTRSGETYKPSALRAYEQALRTRALPVLGHLKLSAVTRNSIQDLVDRLLADGLAASTVRNAVLPLRAIYRRALVHSELLANPTLGLALPAVRGRRERIARPSEARALIRALPESDRALWATALYAGLRRGELQALRWRDVDFDAGLIHVERGWDTKAGPIAPKSRAGRRRVPLARPLRAHLAAHRLLRRGPSGESLVFGGDGGGAFSEAVLHRARAS